MAGDWIKMRTDLITSPKVVRMASALNADRFRIVGGLLSVWSLFDAHSDDGVLSGYDLSVVNELAAWDGFAEAMEAVGWLECNGETIALPRFETHNGQTAKRRAMDANRKRIRRMSASDADKSPKNVSLREEKRREDKEPPLPPKGGCQPKPRKPKAEKISLADFLQTCRDAGDEAIPEDDAVFAYADRIGLPVEFVGLAWEWFKSRYAEKRQTGVKGWRQTFRNAVEGNWPKFWFQADDGEWLLTTAGKQAQAARDAE